MQLSWTARQIRPGAVVCPGSRCCTSHAAALMEICGPGPNRLSELEGSLRKVGFPDPVSPTVCPCLSWDPVDMTRLRVSSARSSMRPSLDRNATSSPLVDNDHGGIASSTVLEAGERRNDTGQRTLNGEWARLSRTHDVSSALRLRLSAFSAKLAKSMTRGARRSGRPLNTRARKPVRGSSLRPGE